ncbi:hypothetical protein CC78DRAFT_537083 [Lojkania enalia]|uniref:Uncharacterized protein n=1 Tax=Lojkania enalia TaxID=147567 RepID=A0A9P4N275_9PLEO|nr:hypothetical protein CC78DRAFT_537083 [Didymosphaeria enalia]
MIRFENGKPSAVWFSQHANGEAFKFSILKKDKSGKRPIVYAANGSHALFPTSGSHDHTIPNLNLPTPLLLVDTTDAGPLYDPLPSSYFYRFANHTFTPYDASAPTAFLYFRGRWGDEQYPDSDKRQQQLVGNRKYTGGPTGPVDKQLERKEIWPQNSWSDGQRVRGSFGIIGVDWEGIGNKFKKLFGKGKSVVRVNVAGEVLK